MLNKLDELRVRTQGYDVIGIVETWVQDQILDSELAIPGYNMYRLDRKQGSGGGVILYVKDTLQSSLCTGMMDTGFEESVWCKVKLLISSLLVGLCYRSPSCCSDNDNTLLTMLEAANRVNVSHIMIMGDFNYPAIDYENGVVSASSTSADYLFFEKMKDLFLVQNVFSNTRFRSGHAPSKLDYVFTSEENLIDEVHSEVLLGKSDHVVLTWFIFVDRCEQNDEQNKKFNFCKGDYDSITTALNKVNWQTEFTGKSAEKMWIFFKDLILQMIKLHVPYQSVHR